MCRKKPHLVCFRYVYHAGWLVLNDLFRMIIVVWFVLCWKRIENLLEPCSIYIDFRIRMTEIESVRIMKLRLKVRRASFSSVLMSYVNYIRNESS